METPSMLTETKDTFLVKRTGRTSKSPAKRLDELAKCLEHVNMLRTSVHPLQT